MSAPVRDREDNGPLKDGPLNYAPKKTRWLEQNHQTQESASTSVNAAPANGITESLEPPWKQKMQPGAFVGDVAMVELRSQLAMAPDRIPEPPVPESSGSTFATAGRILGAVTVAAAAAVGYLWGAAPPAGVPPQQQAALASGEPNLAAPERTAAAGIKASSSNASRPPARPSTIGLAPASAGGPARGGTISVAPVGATQPVVPPGPEPPVIAAPTVPAPTVPAPVAVQPVPDPPVSLSRSVEPPSTGQSSRDPAPVRAAPQPKRPDAAEIALMMKNGAAFMANGNIVAARMMFQPAAEAGEPVAAFALAETYDPLVLKKLGAKGGITSDVALAQSWYEKAKDLGSTVAPERLIRLTRRSE
jgi:hypothetical protein